MPSSVTHNYFSVDVYDKIDKSVKIKIKPNFKAYRVFAQGPDPYFFYDFHLTKKSKEVSAISNAMQHTHINKHFISLINYINEKNYYSNSLVMTYLYGQICHFVLDSTCHPFIIYNTGIFNPNDKSTYKYNGLHEEMEYYIDCFFINQREKIAPKKYKAFNELFFNLVFNEELVDVIDTVTFNVYGFTNVSKKYLKSIYDMKKFYYIFNYDRFGLKKFIYRIMDIICGNRLIRKEELSFHINPYSKIFYLNQNKDKWEHPCKKNEFYNYSFLELYDIALKKAIKIINTVDKMLKSKEIDNKKIEKLLGNLNYGTGKDCDLELEYKYFKF